MAKKVLGRSLGDLLREQQGAGAHGSVGLANGVKELGPGLRVLAPDRRGTAAQNAASPKSEVGPHVSALVKLSLMLGDIGLVVVTVLWQSQATRQLGGMEALVCVGALAAAAWLAGLAAWLHFRN